MTISNQQGDKVLEVAEYNGLYFIPISSLLHLEAHATITLQQAHQRFGHASTERLKYLPASTEGLDIKGDSREFCEACAYSKTRTTPFPAERRTKPSRRFEIVSSDLKGPLLESSKEGYRYYITFNCLFSKWCWISFLRHKSSAEVLEATKRFIADVKADTGQRLAILLTDNGAEYVNQDMSTFLLQKNIKHQRTAPYSPQQNGLAERQNQTPIGMARCVLIESQLPYENWTHAIRYSAHTLNRLPTRSLNWKTPYEKWMGRTPTVGHLRPFGCIAYAHVDTQLRASLHPTSAKCIFLGYTERQKAFVLQRIDNQKILVNRNVVFDERPQRTILHQPVPPQGTAIQSPDPLEIIDLQEECYVNSTSVDMKFPRTYKEAMQSPDARLWHQAASEEMDAHRKNSTWTLVTPPANAKIISGRWVFTTKNKGNEVVYKARYVARGFSQTGGIDYHETFSSVLTMTSLRTLIAIAVTKGWKLVQRDFTTAYLNAPIQIPIYMQQPEGFVQGGGKRKVCLLNKALYGLKQAGRAWQHSLFDLLQQEGFQQLKTEPCLWTKHAGKDLTIVAVYVDDIIITGSNPHMIDKTSHALGNRFKMKELGNLHKFLGITVTSNKDGITLTQSDYITQIAKKYGQHNCKPVATPMDHTYQGTTEEEEIQHKYPTREALGCLMYLSNCTRPDISYAVNNLARHVTKPTYRQWKSIQRIVKYLLSTCNIGIHFSSRSSLLITGWADSDFAGDSCDRNSTTGWLYKIGKNTVAWKSTKQKMVTLSTTEAEYVAACDAAKEAMWLQQLLAELQVIDNSNVPTLNQDNQSAIFIEKNHSVKQRTKHIEIKYHFIRMFIQEGKLAVKYCPTNEMTADILTKPLSRKAFWKHRHSLTNMTAMDSAWFEEECQHEDANTSTVISDSTECQPQETGVNGGTQQALQ